MMLIGNPVYKRETMVSSRSFRLALVLLIFNGILALVALLNMYSTLAQVRVTAEIQYSSFMDLYLFVAVLEFASPYSGKHQRRAGTADLRFNAFYQDDSGSDCNGKACGLVKHYDFADYFQFSDSGSGVCLRRRNHKGHGNAANLFWRSGPVCRQPGDLLLCPVSQIHIIYSGSLRSDGSCGRGNLWTESACAVFQPDAKWGISGFRRGWFGAGHFRGIFVFAAD